MDNDNAVKEFARFGFFHYLALLLSLSSSSGGISCHNC